MTAILLHGFTGSHASWDEVWPEGGEAAIALDLFGHRQEKRRPRWASFDAATRALHKEIASRPGAPFHLVGYSLGARIALALLAFDCDLFERATLIGVQPGLSSAQERQQRIEADDAWAALLEDEGLDVFVAAWEAQPLLAPAPDVPKQRIQRARRIRRQHTVTGLAWCLRTWGLGEMPDFRPALGALALPITLVAGEHDAKFRAIAESMSSALPRGELAIIEGAGHNVLLDRPQALGARLQATVSR